MSEPHGGFRIESTFQIDRSPAVDRVGPTSHAGRLLVALSGGVTRRDLRARAERLRAALEQPDDTAT